MKKPITGNVYKLKDSILVIITGSRSGRDTKTRGELWDWVSFEHSNMSGCTYEKAETKTESCPCELAYGWVDEDCEDCRGTGEVEVTYDGMEDATYLADNVKEYILDRLTNNFDF